MTIATRYHVEQWLYVSDSVLPGYQNIFLSTKRQKWHSLPNGLIYKYKCCDDEYTYTNARTLTGQLHAHLCIYCTLCLSARHSQILAYLSTTTHGGKSWWYVHFGFLAVLFFYFHGHASIFKKAAAKVQAAFFIVISNQNLCLALRNG